MVTPYYQATGVTLYHADCRELLGSLGTFGLVLTDPPYGIGYVNGCKNIPYRTKFSGVRVIGDNEPFDPTALMGLAEKHILWGANHYANKLPNSAGWLVWDKRCNTGSNAQSDCEFAWTDLLGSARIFYHVWDGFRRQTERNVPRVHPTQKPVALMGWCLTLAKNPVSVIDPYVGSGTTLVACKQAGIPAVGIEIDERYCEIAAMRLSQDVLAF